MKNKFSSMEKLPRCLTILLFLIFCSFYPFELAEAQTFLGAGPEAMGDAGRAAINPFDSHFLNPAALAFTSDYSIGAVFQESRVSTDSPGNAYALVVTDNNADGIAGAGFGYVYKRSSTPTSSTVDQDFSLSVAKRIMPSISIGAQGRRLVRTGLNVNSFTKHNIALGALIVPSPIFGISLDAYDILTDDDLDMVPVLAIGTHIIIMDLLRIRADISRQEKKNPDHQGNLGVGLEIVGAEGFLIRTGGLWDTLNKNTYFTAGLSWEGPNLSVAYAYKNNVNVAYDVTHTFQAWVNF